MKPFSKTISVVTGSFLVGAMCIAAPAGATHVAQGGCVTKAEYREVKMGMRQAKVHQIFGTAGNYTALGAPNTIRVYASCNASGGVQVVYSPQGRVVGKTGHWIR